MAGNLVIEQAAERIQSYIIPERLLEHDSAIEAYQKGVMVKIEFCQYLIAPVQTAYEDEKARILGNVG